MSKRKIIDKDLGFFYIKICVFFYYVLVMFVGNGLSLFFYKSWSGLGFFDVVIDCRVVFIKGFN